MDPSTEKALTKTLKFHAKGLRIESGAADDFINRTITAVNHSITKKTTITEKDLKRLVSKELKKYNTDLAYVYKNYDKII